MREVHTPPPRVACWASGPCWWIHWRSIYSFAWLFWLDRQAVEVVGFVKSMTGHRMGSIYDRFWGNYLGVYCRRLHWSEMERRAVAVWRVWGDNELSEVPWFHRYRGVSKKKREILYTIVSYSSTKVEYRVVVCATVEIQMVASASFRPGYASSYSVVLW